MLYSSSVDLLQRVEAILREAESSLQMLVGEAASSGDYQAVRQVNDVAEHLAELRSSVGGSSGQRSAQLSATSADQEREVVLPAKTTRKKKLTRSSSYPRFSRDGDQLVKTSWSKKKREAYQHRASRAVLFAMASALESEGARRRPVVMDRLLPLVLEDKGEVPSYQAYAALAYLKDQSIVEALGRQGYRMTIGVKPAEAEVQRAWEALPSLAEGDDA